MIGKLTFFAMLAVALVGFGAAGCSGTSAPPLTKAEQEQFKGGPRPAGLDVNKSIQDSKEAWAKAHPDAAKSPAAGGGGAGAGTPQPSPGG